MRPAIRRNRELLPAPFGPVKISAPPAAIEKPIPQNTRRPPRMQAKSWPDSFIATISLTLASAAAILLSRVQQGNRMWHIPCLFPQPERGRRGAVPYGIVLRFAGE